MPIPFPHWDPETGKLEEVDYYTPQEVAHYLHVSKETVWRYCSLGKWPHLKVQRRYYMNAEHIARTLELMTVDPDQIPLWEPARLGIAVDPDDIEGVQ